MGLFQMFSHRRGWAFLKKTRIFMKSYPDNDENIQNILLNLPRTPACSLLTAGSSPSGTAGCARAPVLGRQIVNQDILSETIRYNLPCV